MGVEFGGQPAQCGRVDQLIGQHDIAHAERAEDADLADGGGGDRARTRVELAGQQLRGHVRLAVWRQLDPALVAPLRHRGEVVSERVGAQHAHRADGAVGEQVGVTRRTDPAGVRPHHDAGRPLNRQSSGSSASAATAAALMGAVMSSFKLARRDRT